MTLLFRDQVGLNVWAIWRVSLSISIYNMSVNISIRYVHVYVVYIHMLYAYVIYTYAWYSFICVFCIYGRERERERERRIPGSASVDRSRAWQIEVKLMFH